MNIIIYSAVGIVALVIISFVFSYLGNARNIKGNKELALLRSKFIPSEKIAAKRRG